LFVTVIGAMPKHRCQLGISVEMPEPHDFAVRDRRIRLVRLRVHRIPHPTFVTIAKRPSSGHGIRSVYCCFYQNEKQNIQTGLDW